MKKRIIIFYNYFAPAFKAGGPIQSLVSMVQALHESYEIFVIAGSADFGDKMNLPGIETNAWIDWQDMCKVYYWTASVSGYTDIKKIISGLNADIFYINGIYSIFFNLFPLLAAGKNTKIVIAPRGMLHKNALSQKTFKKTVYLTMFRFSGMFDRVVFHATNKTEKQFIMDSIGEKAVVHVAANFPRQMPYHEGKLKKPGMLEIFTIALISPMKNHLKVLQALNRIKGRVVYSIYGPVKDEAYWKSCMEVIQSLPENVRICYKGPVVPDKVEEIIAGNDVMVLPSKSENFGHSIIEALQVGRPVITTKTTPYTDLQDFKAGYSLEPGSLDMDLHSCIQTYIDMDNEAFKLASLNAFKYAEGRINIDQLRQDYHVVFS